MLEIREKPPQYRSYLLRCWEVRSDLVDHPSTWRFSLQDSQTGQKHAFPDLTALLVYLAQELSGTATRSTAARTASE
ncbi:MAG: hypothetical protein JXC32_04955 [Anaerolineae bacterium]|nr:hypothetical protein [Anaerolineae bacterium]